MITVCKVNLLHFHDPFEWKECSLLASGRRNERRIENHEIEPRMTQTMARALSFN